MMIKLITALFITAIALSAAYAQNSEGIEFFGIELGSGWQSISNQHPEAELSSHFRHMIKYDAPFKIYTIQIRNSGYPFVTNAEVSVYQDVIAHTSFRFTAPSEKEYFTLQSELFNKPFIYLTPPINHASHQFNSFFFTNRPQPDVAGSLSYEHEYNVVQLEVGYDFYQELELKWLIGPDIELEE
jgi:hypothetical protein